MDALSIIWTDKVCFEIEFPDPLNLRDPEDVPIIRELDYNLRRMKVTRPDYMNCLKTFICAARSEHPRATINDYILKMDPRNQNAKNQVDYRSIEGKDAVSFEMMSHEFVETVLFGAYFYWDCKYKNTQKDIYHQYADYYLDELAVLTCLLREYVREHYLFKVYDEMERIFYTSFIKVMSKAPVDNEGQLSEDQLHTLDRILDWTRRIDWTKPANTDKVELLMKTLLGADRSKLSSFDCNNINLLWDALKKTRGDGVAVVFQNILGRIKNKSLLKGNMKGMCSPLFDNPTPENNINKGATGKVNKHVKEVIDFVDRYIDKIIFEN